MTRAQVICSCGEKCEELCIGVMPEGAVYRCTRRQVADEKIGLVYFEGCGAQYVLTVRKVAVDFESAGALPFTGS